MNSTVQLSFRYLENDYVRALRNHYFSHFRLRRDMAVAVAIIVIGIYLWRSPSSHWLGVICISVAGFFSIMLAALYTIIPRLAFRCEPKFRDAYSLSFSPEGIHFRTTHIDSQIQWSMYSKALIDDHSYVLYYGTRQFTVIPKRVFDSPEQQLAFESLLESNIRQIVRHKTRKHAA